MKNVRNPNFLCTLPHILRTPDNYLVFSILNFLLFYFLSIPSLIGMDNQYYCILKWKKKILKMKKKKFKFRGYEECEEWYKECKQSILLSYIASHFLYPQQLFSVFNFQFFDFIFH